MTISRLEIKLNSEDRRFMSTSSKGNQIKWYRGGHWFKANTRVHSIEYYEDISEWVASAVMSFSNLPKNMFVRYALCNIEEDGEHFNGCVSKDFLNKGETLITIGRMLRSRGVDVERLMGENTLEQRMAYILNFVRSLTGVDISRYLQTLFTLDALILNEDRHFHNIALIYNETTRQYRLCPIFDNGLSLLSDTREYEFDSRLNLNIATVHAKPFSPNFDKQMSILGVGLQVNGTSLQNFINQHRPTLGRVADVLEYQMNKYRGTIVV